MLRPGNVVGVAAEVAIPGKRYAEVVGFNAHANTSAHANERERQEILVRYLARPLIADERLSKLPDGRLSLRCKLPRDSWARGHGPA